MVIWSDISTPSVACSTHHFSCLSVCSNTSHAGALGARDHMRSVVSTRNIVAAVVLLSLWGIANAYAQIQCEELLRLASADVHSPEVRRAKLSAVAEAAVEYAHGALLERYARRVLSPRRLAPGPKACFRVG